jgi:D-alanine-D-alanine ligase
VTSANDEQLTVALLAGGRSSEHDVSLASGAAVRAGLEQAGHRVRMVRIERDGSWIHAGERLSITPGAGLLDADVVFPALHGRFGEDGVVQGTLETLDVAYVGSGVLASALCMDKVLFKELLSAADVPQVRYVGVREQRWRTARARVLAEIAELGLPVFVKPAQMGSSVGIVKVTEAAQLDAAVEQAFEHDGLMIVEAMAHGIEVECAVLGSSHGAAPGDLDGALLDSLDGALPIASEPGEIVVHGDWYDHEAKYSAGGMELVVPARISARARARVQQLAVETFVRAGCDGLARADFFVDGEQVLVNELNTMPGFTATSVYAKLIAASGIAYPELVDRLCRLAIERHAREGGHMY